MANAPFVRLVIGGTINTVQTWSFGLSFGYVTPATSSDLFTWLSAIGSAVDSWMTDATGGPATLLFGNTTKYNSLSCYQYPANATKSNAQASVVVTPRAGTGSPTPPQLAVVYSLYTGNPGRNQRGRIYVPLTRTPQAGFDSTGQLLATTTSNLATAAANAINAIITHPIAGQTIIPVVAAKGGSPYFALGSVAIGSVVDTQRRRRDKLKSTNGSGAHAI